MRQLATKAQEAAAAGAGGLLAWYDRHRRDLPWRAGPGIAADPYRVWLSEIMLQQTTVAAVAPHFAAFLARWPSVEALAAAPLDEVLRQWAGLGYYARARNLHACAREVVERHDGRFPDSEEGLRALPGIGPYTAAAIAAIAFGRPAAAVDGNVERVVARLYALRQPLPQAKSDIRRLTQALVPADRPGDFAQALMDLGATICTPKRPACILCPWQDACLGRSLGIADTLPLKPAKPERPTRRGVAFWVQRDDGAVLIVRRPDKGLLGGMAGLWTTPLTSDVAAADAPSFAPLEADWQALAGEIEHVFTHFRLRLAVLAAEVANIAAPGGARWVPRRELGDAGLPTVMRKAAAHALVALDGKDGDRILGVRRPARSRI